MPNLPVLQIIIQYIIIKKPKNPLKPESSVAAMHIRADIVFDDVSFSILSHARSIRDPYENAPSMLGTGSPSALSAAVDTT